MSTTVPDSSCDRPVACYPYAHAHCCVCLAVLDAVGGGGEDGTRTAGYEDEHGNGAQICKGCGDDSYLLCGACYDENPYCDACRKDRAA